jgi:hypothetical protein
MIDVVKAGPAGGRGGSRLAVLTMSVVDTRGGLINRKTSGEVEVATLSP